MPVACGGVFLILILMPTEFAREKCTAEFAGGCVELSTLGASSSTRTNGAKSFKISIADIPFCQKRVGPLGPEGFGDSLSPFWALSRSHLVFPSLLKSF